MSAVEVKSYRDLVAWKKAVDLVCATYQQTSRLPDRERYGLVAQMRRSAVSIPSNIAEGWGRHVGLEYIGFLHYARGSIFEFSTQAEICKRLQFCADWDTILIACEEVGRIVNGLINSVQRTIDNDGVSFSETGRTLLANP